MRKLTENLRRELQKPLGEVMSEEAMLGRITKRPRLLIAVGDTCSYMLLEDGIEPDILIYDLKNLRQPVEEKVKQRLEAYCTVKEIVQNPAGTITDELEAAMKRAIDKGKGNIFVHGEEDLAALIALVYAPDGSVVMYGQPHKGVVVMTVDERMRKTAKEMLEAMEKL